MRSRKRLRFQRRRQQLEGMQRASAVEIVDLMPARCPRRNHDCVGLFRQRGEQVELSDLDAEVVVLRFKAERTGHAATTCVEDADVESRDQLEQRHGAAHADEGFLMAVAMEQGLVSGEW